MEKSELINVLSRLSRNARIIDLNIQVKVDKPFDVSKIAEKISLNDIKGKDFIFEDDLLEISYDLDNYRIIFLDKMDTILITCFNPPSPTALVESIDSELNLLAKKAGFKVEGYDIADISIESFSEDNIIKELIKQEFLSKEIIVEDLKIRFEEENNGKMQINYVSIFEPSKKREILLKYPLIIRRRILRHLRELEVPSYYHILIKGKIKYVEEKLNKFSEIIRLTRVKPKTSVEEIKRKIEGSELSEREKTFLIRMLRDITEERRFRTLDEYIL